MGEALARQPKVSIILSAFLISLMVISILIIQPFPIQFAQSQQGNSTLQKQNASQAETAESLDAEMKRLSNSNDPVDIATFAYVWGFPLITNMRTIDQSTDPQHYSESEANGPWNEFHYRTKLANANFTQFVRPNVDTLYSYVYYDLQKEPLVIQVPDDIDRYFTLQFIDAYTDSYNYLGTRVGTTGGTYILTGPNWKGTVPDNMVQINSPTNLGLLFGRVVVYGQDDLQKAVQTEQEFKAFPLSAYDNKTNTLRKSSEAPVNSNNTQKDPIAFYNTSMSGLPEFIPQTGVKLFNEFAYYMAKNMPPANQSNIVDKLAKIGIKSNSNLNNQSVVEFNTTILEALKKGIANGEKLIDQKFPTFGKVVNGWVINTEVGKHPDDYLVRAAIAKFGLWGNIALEALYPTLSLDSNDKALNGKDSNYVLHFSKGQLPPVKKGGFWSITVYNDRVLLHDNPINRYIINDRTQGIKYNGDGSLDLYLQNQKPTDPVKEVNWFPVPDGPFALTMRIYIPVQSVLDGQYSPPPIETIPLGK